VCAGRRVVSDLLQELTEERAQVADLMDQMVAAEDFDPETNKDWPALKTRGELLDRRVLAMREAAEHRTAASDLRDRLTRAPAGRGTAGPDVGEQLLRCEAWRTWKRNGGGGRAHLMSLELNRRALVTTTTFPGGEGTPIYAQPPTASTPLTGAFGNIQSDNMTIPIMTYGPVPPAGSVAEGAQKPEATLTITPTTVTLDTLAHWVEATRQALANDAFLRDLISNGLMRGVARKAELDAAVALQGGNYGTPVVGADMLESVRLGVAQVQSKGYTPNGIVINPADAASLDFAIWGYGGGVGISGSVFGIPVIPVGGLVAGTAFVGDFKTGAAFIYMSGVQLYVSDSDVGIVAAAPVSNFKRNVITFLAEQFSKSVIVNPDAIAECTPTAALGTRGGAGGPTQQPARNTHGGGGGEKK
jgi:Phage capsid family